MAKDRSPNYPAIALGEAVELARKLYAQEKRTPAKAEIAVKAWGYGALSGSARMRIGALRKYGLLDQTLQGLRISDLALRLIQYPQDSPEYLAALREAALVPRLFRALRETHADASDHSLRAYLVTEKGFSEVGAAQLMKAFRATLALAKLEGSRHSEDKRAEELDDMSEATHSVSGEAVRLSDSSQITKPGVRVFSWPLPNDTTAELRLTGGPITQAHLEMLRQYLELAKAAVPKASEGATS